MAGIGVLTLLLASCGGDDDTADQPAADQPAADEPAADEPAADEPADEPAPVDSAGDDAAADDTGADEPTTFEPGGVEYRLVNLTDEPVDVYVRTQGLVQAFDVAMGVAPGSVTDPVAPPEQGTFLVTTAGAGDPECVGPCDHVLVDLTAFADNGPTHTVVLHDSYGEPEAFDLWESPPTGQTAANAMTPADPTVGRVVVTAIDVTGADFGMRLGIAGVPGCVEPVNLVGVLVGGNQTPTFDVPAGSADVSLFDNQDRECAEEPVGGPFGVDVAPGDRTHLLLTGSPGALDAIVLPFVGAGSPATDDSGGSSDDEASGADRDAAIALMADELASEIGLPEGDAACLAPYVVDAIGVAAALVDGELIDLDAADTATQDVAFEGLMEGVVACDVDPASLGG